jgi:hypothetical protein
MPLQHLVLVVPTVLLVLDFDYIENYFAFHSTLVVSNQNIVSQVKGLGITILAWLGDRVGNCHS